jgi:chaperonin GroES
MSKELQANNDRVIIKPVDQSEEMYGSIIIPDMGKEKPEMGEVISVGPGRQSEFGSWI